MCGYRGKYTKVLAHRHNVADQYAWGRKVHWKVWVVKCTQYTVRAVRDGAMPMVGIWIETVGCCVRNYCMRVRTPWCPFTHFTQMHLWHQSCTRSSPQVFWQVAAGTTQPGLVIVSLPDWSRKMLLLPWQTVWLLLWYLVAFRRLRRHHGAVTSPLFCDNCGIENAERGRPFKSWNMS